MKYAQHVCHRMCKSLLETGSLFPMPQIALETILDTPLSIEYYLCHTYLSIVKHFVSSELCRSCEGEAQVEGGTKVEGGTTAVEGEAKIS